MDSDCRFLTKRIPIV